MEIDASTKLLGLLGHPVGHSLSPCLQNAMAEHFGHKLAYLAYDVAPCDLKTAAYGAYALGALGLNVTVPHKQAVREFLTWEDEAASRIGAVNTLKRAADGWHGYNTDMPGFLRALAHDGVDCRNSCVVLLGAGGAANAVLCALLSCGPKRLLIYNRSADKAKALLSRISPFYPGVDASPAVSEAELIAKMQETKEKWIAVNTTSVGMKPDTEAKLIADEAFYAACDVGYDIIFNPKETAFMRAITAADPSNRAFNGLRMLLYQGIRSYEIWNDVELDDNTAAVLLEKLSDKLDESGVK